MQGTSPASRWRLMACVVVFVGICDAPSTFWGPLEMEGGVAGSMREGCSRAWCTTAGCAPVLEGRGWVSSTSQESI